MPRLPLINRIKATEILDSDIIEINRKIPGRPGGTMLGLKTTVAELGVGGSASCVGIDFPGEGPGSGTLLETANTTLTALPTLPSQSCYGPSERSCSMDWITKSFKPNTNAIDKINEIIAQPKEQWIVDDYNSEVLWDLYRNIWQAYDKQLDVVQDTFNQILNAALNLFDTLDNESGGLMDLSCLTTYIETVNSIQNVLNGAKADATDKAAYIFNNPPS